MKHTHFESLLDEFLLLLVPHPPRLALESSGEVVPEARKVARRQCEESVRV